MTVKINKRITKHMLTIARQNRKKISGLNLTPLIDVIFLLMVFFMLTSRFALDQVLNLGLVPIASTPVSEAKPGNTILVLLDADGKFQLWSEDGSKSEDALPLSSLKAAIVPLLRKQESRPVVIVTDAKSSVQQAVSAMESVRDGGAKNVRLARGK